MRQYLTLALGLSIAFGSVGCGEDVTAGRDVNTPEEGASGNEPVDTVEQALVNTDCGSKGTTTSIQQWTSSRGTYALNTTGWCIYREDPKYPRRAIFQSDGNLVVYTGAHSGGSAKWSTGTWQDPKGYRLYFQANGNLVIYDANGVARWRTRTDGSRTGTYLLGFNIYGTGTQLDLGFVSSSGSYTRLWWVIV